MTWVIRSYGWDGKVIGVQRYPSRELAHYIGARAIVPRRVARVVGEQETEPRQVRGNGRYR